MGVITATIDASSILNYLQVGTLEIERDINNRATCVFDLAVRSGTSYRPTIGAAVEIADDGTPIFWGVIHRVRERPVIDDRHTHYAIECVSPEFYASRALFNGIVAAGTLKEQATTLVGNLADFGITIDTGMASGPSLEAQGFPWMTVEDALNQLATLTGWVWSINSDWELAFTEPGTVSAPFNLTASNSTILDLEHEQSYENYINYLWVLYGEGQKEVTQTFTGDGAEDTFELDYTPVGVPATVVEEGVTYPVGVSGGDEASVWNYDASTNALVRTSALGNGDEASVTVTAQFPAALLVEADASESDTHGPMGSTLELPHVFDAALARSIGEGELAKRTGIVRHLQIRTHTGGLEPGQTVSVTAANYDLNADSFLITAVRARHLVKRPGASGTSRFEYDIEAVEGNQTRTNWLEFYQPEGRVSGAGGSSIGTGGSGGSTTVTVTGGFMRVPLGGTTRQLFTAADLGASSGQWFDAPDAYEWSMTGSQIAGSVFVRVHLRTRGGANATIRARLYDETNAVSLGESSDVTADAWTYVGFFVTLPSSEAIVKLQLRVTGSSATTAEVGYWSATAENRVAA